MSELGEMYRALRERLSYDPKTGMLIWKNSYFKRLIGKQAGHIKEDYYRFVIRIEGKDKQFYAHRVCWLLHYGVWPKNEIDHINGIRTDNRIINLRDVEKRVNNQNTKKVRSGRMLGAYYNKSNKKWRAKILKNKQHIHLGYFKTEKEAHEAYMKEYK